MEEVSKLKFANAQVTTSNSYVFNTESNKKSVLINNVFLYSSLLWVYFEITQNYGQVGTI